MNIPAIPWAKLWKIVQPLLFKWLSKQADANPDAAPRWKPTEWLSGMLRGNKVVYTVALERYADPSANLNGPRNDARIVQDEAKSRGYKVRSIADAEATRAGVLAFLREAVAEANGGKRVRYYSSGHGTQRPDRNGDEADHKDGGIVCFDMQVVLDDEFAAICDGLKPGADFAVILDICYSGEFPRAVDQFPKNPHARYLPADRATWPDAASVPRVHVADVSALTASGEQQVSMELSFGGTVYGAFTYHLIKRSVRDAGSRSLAWHRDDVAGKLRDTGMAQVPHVRGNGERDLF